MSVELVLCESDLEWEIRHNLSKFGQFGHKRLRADATDSHKFMTNCNRREVGDGERNRMRLHLNQNFYQPRQTELSER